MAPFLSANYKFSNLATLLLAVLGACAVDLGAMSTVSLCQVTRALVAWGEYHAGACDAVALAVARLPDAALDGEVSKLFHLVRAAVKGNL